MTRFYKKGPLGMVKAEAGMSDPDVAEVRMSMKEYRGLLDDIQSAEKSAASARAMAEDRIDRIKENAREKIEDVKRQAEADAEKKVAAAQADVRRIGQDATNLRKHLEEAKEIIRNEKYLNANMTRIMRERANQARGIQPKKRHDGYIVLESRQWIEKYTEETWDTEDHKRRYSENRGAAIKKKYLRIENKTVAVWKSILQTPYDASIPLENIQYRVEEEDLWKNGILKDIGCRGMCESFANGRYTNFGRDDNGDEKNGLYKWVFRANYRTGFWELEIYTTKALTVPEYRRPTWAQKKTRKVKAKNKKQPEPKPESNSSRGDAEEKGNLFEGLEGVAEDNPEWDEDFFEDFDPM